MEASSVDYEYQKEQFEKVAIEGQINKDSAIELCLQLKVSALGAEDLEDLFGLKEKSENESFQADFEQFYFWFNIVRLARKNKQLELQKLFSLSYKSILQLQNFGLQEFPSFIEIDDDEGIGNVGSLQDPQGNKTFTTIKFDYFFDKQTLQQINNHSPCVSLGFKKKDQDQNKEGEESLVFQQFEKLAKKIILFARGSNRIASELMKNLEISFEEDEKFVYLTLKGKNYLNEYCSWSLKQLNAYFNQFGKDIKFHIGASTSLNYYGYQHINHLSGAIVELGKIFKEVFRDKSEKFFADLEEKNNLKQKPLYQESVDLGEKYIEKIKDKLKKVLSYNKNIKETDKCLLQWLRDFRAKYLTHHQQINISLHPQIQLNLESLCF